MKISLPNQWAPTSHQANLWTYMMHGGQRAAAIWHRRAGKDSVSINFTAVKAHQRIGTYWHMLPTSKQARKVVWDSIDRHGRRVIDQAFPRQLRTATNNTDMRIELLCGSIWQCVGSDNYDSLVGANPVGIVFSEYSVADPAAWDFIRPILRENGGWAIFIYTPRGRNHGYRLLQAAKKNPEWFWETLTIEDTHREDGTPIMTKADVEQEISEGMDAARAKQEFYCSFDAGLQGAFYAPEMERAWKEKRVGAVPYDPELPVHTAWDLGINDQTAIWFYQKPPSSSEVRFIRYYENKDEALHFYISYVKDQEYLYGHHWAPHDIKVREYTLGGSRWEKARDLGMAFDIAPKLPVSDGIDASRSVLRKAWFDKTNCERGIECLENYQKRWDDRLKVYSKTPLHNWASNGADAFRVASTTINSVLSGISYEMAWDEPIAYPKMGII